MTDKTAAQRATVRATDDLRRQAHFLEELEMAIRISNQEIIGGHIPELDRDAFLRLAVVVAKVRAAYLEQVLTMDWNEAGDTAISDLRHKREVYEEARAGFEALRRCIEVGYVAIATPEGDGG